MTVGIFQLLIEFGRKSNDLGANTGSCMDRHDF